VTYFNSSFLKSLKRNQLDGKRKTLTWIRDP